MMDGSLAEDGKTPASYEYNVAVTKEVVKMAMLAMYRSRVSLVAWDRSNPAWEKPRMVTELRGLSATTNF